MINPAPAKKDFRESQIWRSSLLNEFVIITDASLAVSAHTVRAAVLSPVHNLGDGNDVILNPVPALKRFIPTKRVCLRVTDAAIPAEDLIYTIGKVSAAVYKNIKKSLLNTDFHYTAYAMDIIAGYLQTLGNLRTVALTRYESLAAQQTAPPQQVMEPPKVSLQFIPGGKGKTLRLKDTSTHYLLAAADDAASTDEVANLFAKEFLSKKKAIVYRQKDTEVHLSILNNALYFVVFSNSVRFVSEISLKIGDTILQTARNKISLYDSRAILPFVSGVIPAGEGELLFRLDRSAISVPVVLE